MLGVLITKDHFIKRTLNLYEQNISNIQMEYNKSAVKMSMSLDHMVSKVVLFRWHFISDVSPGKSAWKMIKANSEPNRLLNVCLPVPASSLQADPVFGFPSHPDCPTLHLNFHKAKLAAPSLACQSQPSLLQVNGGIHPPRGSCCLRRRAEERSWRQRKGLVRGTGISQQRSCSVWSQRSPGRG